MHVVHNPCHSNNGGCSHFCLLSAVDSRGYSCSCPEGMILDDDQSNCIFLDGAPMAIPLSPLGIIEYINTLNVKPSQ